MNRVFAVTVNNHTGVLNRITGLFLRRDFNIQSITVGATETEGISRMTIVLNVDDERVTEQVVKQLYKQIDVLKVQDITDIPTVARELVLIRVNSPLATRSELTTLIDPFRASIIDVSRDSVTIQAVGSPEKVEALIFLLQPYGIKELARTGVTAVQRANEAGEAGRPSRNFVLSI
ncbi:acetolactate synthase small subunit [Alicyclobacillus curvatus]|jgi:acetolactate synthase I/III small subunit|nr:acetolactate synthase small subunit [Alicyclobacillus curvatus]